MLRYIAGRLAQSILTLFLLSILIFLLARVLGDPVQFMMGLDVGGAEMARITHLLGLDRPLWVQYLDFLGGLLRGDLGTSVRQQVPVTSIISERCGTTVCLVAIAAAGSILVSLVLGTAAALNRGGVIDWMARMIATIGQSAPSFWVGIVLIQLFSVRLQWLPAAGNAGIANYVLPAVTLGLLGVAGMTRLLRSSMLDVLDMEYVKKARIMGLSESTIIVQHCLRNACLPVLTYAGEYIGQLITAAVVVEVIFALPGMGRLAYEAVFTRDYPLIQGIVLVVAAVIMLLNLLVDILYAYADPRIRYERR